MRIIDDRQTGMFSYRDGICNRAGLNVEEEDSTAYLCILRDGRDARPPLFLLCFQVDGFYWEVPVGCQNFETLLLFAVVSFFVGE